MKKFRLRIIEGEIMLELNSDTTNGWVTDTYYRVIDNRVTQDLVEKINTLTAYGWEMVV